MKKIVNDHVLVSIDIDDFWPEMRKLIRQEITKVLQDLSLSASHSVPNGVIEKPLYTIGEVCKLFDITRPSMYEWIKDGRLQLKKNRGRVYFLASDIRLLINKMSNDDKKYNC